MAKSFSEPDIDCRICITPIRDIEYKEVRAPAERQALLLFVVITLFIASASAIGGRGCRYHLPLMQRARLFVHDALQTDSSAEIDRAWHRISEYAEGSFRARVKREPRQVDGSIRVKPELREAEGKSESSAAALIRQQNDEYVAALAEDLLSGKVSGGGGQSLEEQQLIAAIQQSLKEAKAEAQTSQKQESIQFRHRHQCLSRKTGEQKPN
eukprot:g58840.t1